MISVRFVALLSTILLVTGALLLGDAIHQSVVTGTYAVTSVWVVLRVVLGIAFIALGYRFQTPADEYVSVPSGESSQKGKSTEGANDFDPELSPLDDEQFESLDADEEK